DLPGLGGLHAGEVQGVRLPRVGTAEAQGVVGAALHLVVPAADVGSARAALAVQAREGAAVVVGDDARVGAVVGVEPGLLTVAHVVAAVGARGHRDEHVVAVLGARALLAVLDVAVGDVVAVAGHGIPAEVTEDVHVTLLLALRYLAGLGVLVVRHHARQPLH